ncbi:MAG: TetR/AcrR family transcriptional regulator [Burkholderiales bacterium]|nr:MAG: TetR/AcrR family transcriptional regulator [Betaproteobacteria bacterium]TAG28892.1 MAG: TetR/AcrR family transcriptional regulator [Burkholderiales bacterium]
MATPYRLRQLEMREEAILDAAHQLLGKMGYEEMTMDVVAAEVGIAKASLYKHFPSKEKLAARTMTRLFERTNAELERLANALPAIEKLRIMLRWVLVERLAGSIPHLPSTNGALEQSLLTDEAYLAALFTLNANLSALVEQAKSEDALNPALPTDFIVTAIYARSCDPTLDYMQRGNSYSGEEIVAHMVSAFFVGVQR